MEKCTDLGEIRNKVTTLIVGAKRKKLPLDKVKASFSEWFKESSKNWELEQAREIADTIYATCREKGIADQSSDFFNSDYIYKTITQTKEGVESDPLDTTTERLVDSQIVYQQVEANTDFLNDAYGLATEVRGWATRVMDQNLFDALFINRGSVNTYHPVVRNVGDLNSNIRDLHNVLLGRIADYLSSIVSEANLKVSNQLARFLKNPNLYKGNKIALKEFNSLLNSYLAPDHFTADILKQLYYNTISNNVDQKLKEQSRLRLEAYNAHIFLKHFDSYLTSILGKAIKIKDFGRKTGKDKYSLARTTSNLLNSWRRSENINTEAEADTITKMAVTTTPVYAWQETVPITGQYLEFADFEHIVTKLKDLAYNPEVHKVVFNEDFRTDYKDLWDSLKDSTKRAIEGKSLPEVLSQIRRNPRQNISAAFELFTNKRFYDLYKSTFLNKNTFNDDQLNKMYSLARGIFGAQFDNSIYSLSSANTLNDFYAYITQSADSITSVQYTQYYQDETTQLRTLADQTINNIMRTREQAINSRNSIQMISNWGAYKQSLNLTMDNDIITFKIPNTDYIVKVGKVSGTVNILKDGKKVSIGSLHNDANVVKFVDKYLALNLATNPVLYNTLESIYDDSSAMYSSLIQMASRIVADQYISKEIVSTYGDVNNDLKSNFGSELKYNHTLNELNLVRGIDAPMLRRIAQAYANVQGFTSSAQVKDGLGNGQSRYSFSRLLGMLPTQFELQEKQSNSATNRCMLMSIPGLFEGAYTAKEFQSAYNDNKPTTSMSASEMIYSNFIYDFIGGLIDQDINRVPLAEDGTPLVGNGHVMFLPSVNSDKSTIGKARFNLNQLVNVAGQTKAIKDLTNDELKILTQSELGFIYQKAISNIRRDWATLQNFMANHGASLPFQLADDWVQGFAQMNNYKITPRDQAVLSSFMTEHGFSAPIQIKNTVDFIKEWVRAYNIENRLHPISFIDQVHFKSNGGKLAINETIPAQLAKYNPTYLQQIGGSLSKYYTFDQFHSYKKAEVVKSILKNKAKLTLEEGQVETAYMMKNYPDWVNRSGNIIIAKLRGINITRSLDLEAMKNSLGFNSVADLITNLKDELELNPLLEKYNLLEGLLTQEFMNCTVGSFIAHPDKSKSLNVIEQEASQFNAQHKRNVSMTAAMHEFQLGLLTGIPSDYNIAVVEDIKDEQGLISGLISEIKPFDGATFVHPCIVHLENNSLGGARAGITKKQFVHFKDQRTATGGIIKTAGFGITNNWIRNSPFYQNMVKKMMNNVWLNSDGSAFQGNILKNFRGETINILENIGDDNIYFQQGGKYYKITNIQNTGINTYTRTLQEITKTGSLVNTPPIQDTQEINTNWKLWNFLGGKDSMEMSGNTLVPSENSILEVVNMMNEVGVPTNPMNTTNINTQDDVWQPLKMSDVHYVVTAGAIKQGGANINPVSRYSDDVPYDIQKIHMYQAGIQLDKEHHADEEDISLMTQVISACAAKGYTFELASKLYEALSVSTQVGIREQLDAVINLFNNKQVTNDQIQEVIMRSIVDSIGNTNKQGTNFVEVVARDLQRKALEGKEIKYSDALIPLSDNHVYAKLLSTLSSYITNAGIKAKIPGVLAVLTPSYNIFRLYADRKYESFTNPDEELDALQAQQAPVFDVNDPTTNISNLELGRNYFIVDRVVDPMTGVVSEVPQEKSVLIRTPQEYRTLKTAIRQGLIARVTEDLKAGRDLAGYNARFNDTNGTAYQIYDLDSYAKKFKIEDIIDKLKKSSFAPTPKFSGSMSFFYGSNARPDIKSLSTFDAILNGERTATTRYASDGNISYWSHLQKGDIVKFTDGIRELYVRITKPLTKLSDRTSAKTWSKKEGWSEEYFNKLKQSDKWKSGAYQFEYELITPTQAFAETNPAEYMEYGEIESFIQNALGITQEIPYTQIREYARQADVMLNRQLQKDLQVLSPTHRNAVADLDDFLVDIDPNHRGDLLAYVNWINTYLENGNGDKLIIDGQEVPLSEANFAQVNEQIREHFASLNKVKIDGNEVDVDYSTLNIQPYEIILPKTFKTAFGLDDFADLNQIVNDPEFFVKEYQKNQYINTDNYDLALKKSNGKHFYLMSPERAVGRDLTRVDEQKIFKDGKVYRTDIQGNILYQLGKKDKIYTDSLGNEIIVTDNFEWYLKRLDFDSIQIANSTFGTSSETAIFDALSNCMFKREVRDYYNFVNVNEAERGLKNLEYQDTTLNDKLLRRLHSKHSSLLKSLNIVASRTPSQSMQSFMPMKVVAFDNPDINNAYVSTYQLLLQGSDYDIDAVSLATYDINHNGLLQLWSPYADLSTKGMLEESMTLPFPTGQELVIQESTDRAILNNTISELQGLRNIIKASNIDGKLQVNLDIHDIQGMESFKHLLSIADTLVRPTITNYQKVLKALPEIGTVESIPEFFDNIQKIINNHNLYLDAVSQRSVERMVNNYTMNSMYNVILDPVNLIQAQTSVDGTTGPLKAVANTSAEARESKTETPFNFVNKFESVIRNQVGKQVIGICAIGLKTFFGITQYCNYVLNNGTSEQQRRIILGKEGKGITVGNKTYYTLANIRPLSPNTIKSRELLRRLAGAKNDVDACITLSALLSLATDFRTL